MRSWVEHGSSEPASSPAALGSRQGASDLGQPAGQAATVAPIANHQLRGELNAPLRGSDAFHHYRNLQGGDLTGADDLRLEQMNRIASQDNAGTVRNIDRTLREAGVDAKVYGRAKTPASMFGKLLETPGMRIGDIKDMSGARVDLTMQRPGFEQVYEARQAVQGSVGNAYHAGKDYIAKPNPWGYTGRIHDGIQGSVVPNTELQYGSRDLSAFIDGKVTNASGQSRSVHDLTGYKGQLYGARVPDHLQEQYPQLMRDIAANDKAGLTVAQNSELKARIDGFRNDVTNSLPDRFSTPPEPARGRSAQLKNLASRGLGGLGVAGGGLQVSQDVQELKDGKIIEGSGNLVSGTASTTAGSLLLFGRAALGTSMGGVAAGVDGGKDIVTGIRDGSLEKTVVGTVKAGAGTAMMTGVATANPPLIAGGAITYGGAVAYESRDALVEGAAYVGGKTWDGVSYVGGKAWDSVTYVGGKAVDGVSYVGGKTIDGVAYVGGKTIDGVSYVGGKAWDGLSYVGGSVSAWFGR